MSAESPTTQSRSTPNASSSAVTINAAFFEEIKEAHFEVDELAKRIMRLGVHPNWTDSVCRELTDQLNRLSELVRWYFSLEETYGYFEDPVFVSAAYSQRVSDLRAEHKSLLAEIKQLSDHAARLLYNGRLPHSADVVLARFGVFRDQFQRHEYRERELITEGFSVDIGCGD